MVLVRQFVTVCDKAGIAQNYRQLVPVGGASLQFTVTHCDVYHCILHRGGKKGLSQ